jgi:glycosyltransferase involved in cell wall biosynthesis
MFATFKAVRIACRMDKFDGAIVLNDVNFFTAFYLQAIRRMQVVMHLDGDESARRGIPWPGRLLHWLMRLASLNFINKVVVDSRALLRLVPQKFSTKVRVIKYGFPNISINSKNVLRYFPELDGGYFLNIARFVPENNVAEIMESYLSSTRKVPLVVLGKGTGSKNYESKLEDLAMKAPGKILILNAEYNTQKLCTLIGASSLYIHGHEAGGTNPVLVTARHFASNLASHDNFYNREDCRSDEKFWSESSQLKLIMESEPLFDQYECTAMTPKSSTESWHEIADQYFDLLFRV